jgi:hypothetical protein
MWRAVVTIVGVVVDHFQCSTCNGWWAEREGVRVMTCSPLFGQKACTCTAPTRKQVTEVTRIDKIVWQEDDGETR